MRTKRSRKQAFTRFVKETEPRLSYALAAAYGPEVRAEATADTLAYAIAAAQDRRPARPSPPIRAATRRRSRPRRRASSSLDPDAGLRQSRCRD